MKGVLFLLGAWVVLMAVSYQAISETEIASNTYRDRKIEFLLPEKAVLLEQQNCGRETVGNVPSSLTNFRCMKVFYNDSEYLILESTETRNRKTWQFKILASGDQIELLGDLNANYAIVPIVAENNLLEFLAVNRNGGNVSYERHPVVEGALVAVTSAFEGPRITSTSGGASPNTGYRGERNLSDEFYSEKIAAITKYSDWQTAPFTFRNVSFVDGTFRASYSEVPTTIQNRINEREAQMNRGFSWGTFLDQTSENAISSSWRLTCLFPVSEGEQLSQIGEGGSGQVKLKLVSATDGSLTFDCKF